jgi:hypothetical protein
MVSKGFLCSISMTCLSEHQGVFYLTGISGFLLQVVAQEWARDRCYDFKNIFAEMFLRKYWRFLLKLLQLFAKI